MTVATWIYFSFILHFKTPKKAQRTQHFENSFSIFFSFLSVWSFVWNFIRLNSSRWIFSFKKVRLSSRYVKKKIVSIQLSWNNCQSDVFIGRYIGSESVAVNASGSFELNVFTKLLFLLKRHTKYLPVACSTRAVCFSSFLLSFLAVSFRLAVAFVRLFIVFHSKLSVSVRSFVRLLWWACIWLFVRHLTVP